MVKSITESGHFQSSYNELVLWGGAVLKKSIEKLRHTKQNEHLNYLFVASSIRTPVPTVVTGAFGQKIKLVIGCQILLLLVHRKQVCFFVHSHLYSFGLYVFCPQNFYSSIFCFLVIILAIFFFMCVIFIHSFSFPSLCGTLL